MDGLFVLEWLDGLEGPAWMQRERNKNEDNIKKEEEEVVFCCDNLSH